ncbi:MAG: hypothetical protein OXC93_16505 [Rhodospirillaceae bacterium]|nr:hypothetical protein [Rhodospirillaceae bacterium]
MGIIAAAARVIPVAPVSAWIARQYMMQDFGCLLRVAFLWAGKRIDVIETAADDLVKHARDAPASPSRQRAAVSRRQGGKMCAVGTLLAEARVMQMSVGNPAAEQMRRLVMFTQPRHA